MSTNFFFKSLLKTAIKVLTLHLKQTFLAIIWIFTEGEDDGKESGLPSYNLFLTFDLNSFNKKMKNIFMGECSSSHRC